jgi:REP element-mobilizing transposase RayT
MSRPPRIEVPFGYYHLAARGNDRQVVFDDALRKLFLLRLARVAKRFEWSIFAWALMSNHFHLVLQLGDRGLSDGMRELNTWCANASNARFGRVDHCFGKRFWSAELRTEPHFLASLRYTLWNPARAGVGAHPGESSWTSFRPSIGLDWPHEALALHRLLEYFGSDARTARRSFKRFVWDGRERCLAPWRDGAGALR